MYVYESISIQNSRIYVDIRTAAAAAAGGLLARGSAKRNPQNRPVARVHRETIFLRLDDAFVRVVADM